MTLPREIDQLLQHGPDAYREVVTDDIYGLARAPGKAAPEVLFDLGANRGCFSVMAARAWPSARVIALEPHRPTYGALCEVAALMPQITPVLAAIADGPGFFTEAHGECGHQYSGHASSPSSVPTAVQIVTPLELVAMAAGKPYGVKVDVEGTEFELFETPHEHLFRNAAIWWLEIHIPTIDDFLVGNLEPGERFLQERLARAHRALAWLHRQTTTHEISLWMPNPIIWMATGLKTVRPWRP